MKMLKLSKPIKTVVKDYEMEGEGSEKKQKKDEKGNPIASGSREVKIANVEVPQYESLAEATQIAGSEEKVLEYINASVKADAITPLRVVGGSFSLSDSDESIITKALELASKFNPFTDRRKSESTKALADKYKEVQALLNSGADDADILAMLKSGKL